MHEGRFSDALWTAEDARDATGGRLVGADSWIATGVSIDTRTLAPGDLFVALKDQRDGHAFVADAFAKGAAAALVGNATAGGGVGPLLVVEGVTAGLRGLAARARDRGGARRAAITGSVGKTSVKEALAAALALAGPTHAAAKSFNNHFGVPLTLSRMAPGARYAVFEIGMNHRGEIAPLAQLVRPHAAAITTIAGVHLENLGSLQAIAEEKSDIFTGLEPGGVALVPADAPYAEILKRAAEQAGARPVLFGKAPGADLQLLSFEMEAGGSRAEASLFGERAAYRIGAPGAPWATNALVVLGLTHALTGEFAPALEALATLQPAAGRGLAREIKAAFGTFTLVDDAYNASPVSVRAALETLAARPTQGRRLVALGDMLELGPDELALHAGLKDPILAAGVAQVFLAGPRMNALWAELPEALRGGYAPDADSLIPQIVGALRPNDIILIKGSNSSRMGRVVEALGALGVG